MEKIRGVVAIAKAARVSVGTASAWLKGGDLPSTLDGRTRVVKPKDLERFLARRTAEKRKYSDELERKYAAMADREEMRVREMKAKLIYTWQARQILEANIAEWERLVAAATKALVGEFGTTKETRKLIRGLLDREFSAIRHSFPAYLEKFPIEPTAAELAWWNARGATVQ